MKERLHKVLAAAGIASRRTSEAMIAAGEVMVNGKIATIGQQVDKQVDSLVVRGVPLTWRIRTVYLALNKPVDIVTSLHSTHGERTVMELVRTVPERIYPVGRLDKDTSGLLLMSNDGEWTNIVTHPRFGIEKQYIAAVRGHPSREVLARLGNGVELPDGTRTARADVKEVGKESAGSILSITLVEGKKRQIRLMAQAVGHPVLRLRRVRIGPIVLGRLEEGAWRYLSAEEVENVRDQGRLRHR